jgi:uncharacterized protein YqjF (DUF2071 family)
MHPALKMVKHRPYPPPGGPWVMAQTWLDLLFMHWPVNADALRPLIPEALEIDTFDGMALVGVVPLLMKDVHFKFLPPIPSTSEFLELNVRTYVKWRGKSGVYFFSLDAASLSAVEVARLWYCLPYFHANMSATHVDDAIHFKSERRDSRGRKAILDMSYAPTDAPYTSKKNSLDAWLTERYCLLTLDRSGKVLVGEIHHQPWPLQPARAEIVTNTMASAVGISLPQESPILHFSSRLETVVWSISAPKEDATMPSPRNVKS